MKKLLLLFILSSLNQLNAQTVNGIPISEIDVEYIQIKGISNPNSYKINILIDFGQEMKYYTNGNITDDKGKKVKFNSMIEALNFMNKSGYDFVQAYGIFSASKNIDYYIMKRKKKE
jgi:hypothetical protein